VRGRRSSCSWESRRSRSTAVEHSAMLGHRLSCNRVRCEALGSASLRSPIARTRNHQFGCRTNKSPHPFDPNLPKLGTNLLINTEEHAAGRVLTLQQEDQQESQMVGIPPSPPSTRSSSHSAVKTEPRQAGMGSMVTCGDSLVDRCQPGAPVWPARAAGSPAQIAHACVHSTALDFLGERSSS
jgi:hypothetical protein